ncbi:uncharacterized protein LOC142471189 [Ascaphus truei]|uniref:uncharacterized protein LOC142471189 n=1 Tax=Ascaphus truei TaxID=8439 RepID=UPI003F5A4177
MMFQVVSSLLLLSLFSVGQGNSKNVISVSNGGKLGDWGPVEMCPVGSRARGFSVKLEEFQWFGDDTSLNGIRLLCFSSNNNGEYSIQSTEGAWGSWTSPVRCPNGSLIAFNLVVSPPQGDGDDTAANNIVFMCSDETILVQPLLWWGSSGRWSQICKIGICGISTRVEEYQGKGDDTALNDVKFTCCENFKEITKKSGEQQSKNLETLRGDQLEIEFVPESSSCEYDVSFKRPQALDYFWTKYESLKNSELWKSFAAIPVSKPDTKKDWGSRAEDSDDVEELSLSEEEHTMDVSRETDSDMIPPSVTVKRFGWGSWTSPVWCPNGNLIAFSLRVETPLWFGDDTAANNIMFKCSDNSILEGSGQSWGTYEGWSESCQIGICGIQTKVEPTQGDGDDTALNDVKFTCCVEDYYLVGLH